LNPSGVLADEESEIRAGRQEKFLKDISNFREAFKAAIQIGLADEVILSHQSLFWIYEIQGWFVDGSELFKWCLIQIEDDTYNEEMKMVEGLLYAMLGRMEQLLGNQIEGTQHMLVGQELLKDIPYRVEKIFCENLWLLSSKAGELPYDQLYEYYSELIERFQGAKQIWGEAIVHNLWGQTALGRGVLDDAKTHLEEALRLNRMLNDTRGIAWSLGGLGGLAYLQKKLEEAKLLYEESLAAHKQVGYSYLVALMHRDLGNVCGELQQNTESVDNYYKALEIFNKTNTRSYMVVTRIDIANTLMNATDHDGSTEHLELAHMDLDDTMNAPIHIYFALVLARWLTKTRETDLSFDLIAWILQHPAWDKGFGEFLNLLLTELEEKIPEEKIEKLREGEVEVVSSTTFSEATQKLMQYSSKQNT
jgi:tetratricopeptide (TPR) repeat protein